MSNMYHGGDPTPEDDGKCMICCTDCDYHTDEERDACDYMEAVSKMPQKGFRVLVYKSAKDMDVVPEFGAWHWIDLDGLGSKDFEFVTMAVKNGKILEDLG